ncbi:MAG: hypothetical protein WA303_02905 [Bradyrhizobium sp.]|jgi:hypothetical protein
MRAVTVVAFALLLGLLGAVGWFAFTGLTAPGEPMPAEGYAALVAGAVFAIIVGVGLMALLFYSSRKGYDEPPHFHADDD